jgi:phosphorylated adapter RNA export protein
MTNEPVQTPEEELTKHIADTLQERNHSLIKQIVHVVGAERTQEFLQKTLELEAAGGLMTTDSSRRRTPGGVFFYTVRRGIPKEEQRRIWPQMRKKQQGEGAHNHISTNGGSSKETEP